MTTHLSPVEAAVEYDRRRPNRSRRLNSALALELYQTGASDPEIALATGFCRRGIKAWRDARSLPPNRDVGGRAGVRVLTPTKKAEALRLLRQGHQVKAVAARFGLAPKVLSWHRDKAAREGVSR